MTVEKVDAYKTSDGSLFSNKNVAEAYDKSNQFAIWCKQNLRSDWDAEAISTFILQHWTVSLK